MITTVLFDYGGVIAEEGFREGMTAIARRFRRDPGRFFHTAQELVYSTGYVTGRIAEGEYWDALRRETGISEHDRHLRTEVLERFLLNLQVIDVVRRLKRRGLGVGIMSDQTNWLDELNQRDFFFYLFDAVINSYHTHKSKRDPYAFTDACASLGCPPGEVLFVDDTAGNIERAAGQGLQAVQFRSVPQFHHALRAFLR